MRRKTVVQALAVAAVAMLVSGCGPADDPEPSVSAPASPTASVPSETATPTPTPTPTEAPAATVTPPSETSPAPEAEPPSSEQGGIAASSIEVVVNKRTPLQPADYQPELVAVSTAQDGDELVRPEANTALVALSEAMRAEIGEGIHVFSSYRSHARQAELYNGYVAQYGQASADTTSARPGHSEHQTGLAVDVMGTGGQCRLNVCFGDTAAGRWIAENSWQHGFIVRYPNGLEGVTGYHYEPWHLRYVGVEISTAMHEQGAATLEEFFGMPAAPDYG